MADARLDDAEGLALSAATELAAAIRGLLHSSVSTAVGADELRTAADRVRVVSNLLNRKVRGISELSALDDGEGGSRNFNPVTGAANPVAVPLVFAVEGDTVVAYAAIPRVFEGPPTYVHGGMSSMVMDQVLGQAAIEAGRWGLTVKLETTYHHPVPLEVELVISGRICQISGRRTTVEGSIATAAAPSEVLVSGRGVFVTPRPEVVQDYFGSLTTADGRAAATTVGGLASNAASLSSSPVD